MAPVSSSAGAERGDGRSGGVLRCLILRVEGRTRRGLRDHPEATGATPVLDPRAAGRAASLAYAAAARSMAGMVLFPSVESMPGDGRWKPRIWRPVQIRRGLVLAGRRCVEGPVRV